jgi:hypothetical protein
VSCRKAAWTVWPAGDEATGSARGPGAGAVRGAASVGR